VDCSVEPRDRQIVVAMRDSDFTVKHRRQRNRRVFLEAENPKFSPIEVVDQELMIWGVVTFVIHKPR
jgi:DNA polymerase V